MRLVCLHADTIDALKRLNIQVEDLTPSGLWSSQYHLVGLTPDQIDALEVFKVQVEDVTPAQLAQGTGQSPQPAHAAPAEQPRPAQAARDAAERAATADAARPATGVATAATPAADPAGREPVRATGGNEAEVPLAQARDGGTRPGEGKSELKAEAKPEGKAAGGKGGNAVASPSQAGRKGQPPATGPAGGGQRYGTTRLRISVAGKYTEATVANGKIVVAGRSFDSPDQAAAELTKSRGDWTFWEYYDSADGKWRMLTRDWDTVLKSAAPGGR